MEKSRIFNFPWLPKFLPSLIHGYSEITVPLKKMSYPQGYPLDFSNGAILPLKHLKRLSPHLCLPHWIPDTPKFTVEIDASDYALSAVLSSQLLMASCI